MESVNLACAGKHWDPARYDLIVMGGGPAGSSAAITAARAGVRVLLIERGRMPRQRVCGEFVSAESLALLVGLLGDSVRLVEDALRIPGARLFIDGQVISAPVIPPAASISRFDLDAALWHAAANSGVDARLQTRVETVAGRGPFRVVTSAGDFESRAVINATGRWSNLTSRPHTSKSGEPWLGLKAHFTETSSRASVDLYFFDGGYCGVQPVHSASLPGTSCINACAMVRSDIARTLPDVFTRHAELWERSRAWQPLMEPVTTSPLRFHDPQPTLDGMLLVGDAAGFVDPFVGDGISLALRSGTAAAECLLPFFRKDASLPQAARGYGDLYRHKLLPVFRNSSKLRRFLKLPPALRSPIARLLQNTPSITRYLVNLTR